MLYSPIHPWRARLLGSGMFLAVALLTVGCEQALDPAPIVPEKLDPEESFARVLAQLKLKFRGFDDVSSLSAGGGGSRRVKFSYVVHDVSGEVNMPTDADSSGITAQVSVHTSTSYEPLDPYVDSRTVAPSAVNTTDDKTAATSTSTDGVEITAVDRMAGQRANARVEEEIRDRVRSAVDKSLSELGGEKTEVFDFAFKDGRWVLTTVDVKESDRIVIEGALVYQRVPMQ